MEIRGFCFVAHVSFKECSSFNSQFSRLVQSDLPCLGENVLRTKFDSEVKNRQLA